MTSPARGVRSGGDGCGAEQDQYKRQSSANNLLAKFVLLVGLSDEDRKHLGQHRSLPPSFVEGRFASGTVERVQHALEKLIEQGVTEAELRQAHLIDKKGLPLGYLTVGKILIPYRDENDDVICVRAHQLGPKGVQLEVYGREFLFGHSGHVVICEGEFKAALLLAFGVSALAVPGIFSFVGENFERFL